MEPQGRTRLEDGCGGGGGGCRGGEPILRLVRPAQQVRLGHSTDGSDMSRARTLPGIAGPVRSDVRRHGIGSVRFHVPELGMGRKRDVASEFERLEQAHGRVGYRREHRCRRDVLARGHGIERQGVRDREGVSHGRVPPHRESSTTGIRFHNGRGGRPGDISRRREFPSAKTRLPRHGRLACERGALSRGPPRRRRSVRSREGYEPGRRWRSLARRIGHGGVELGGGGRRRRRRLPEHRLLSGWYLGYDGDQDLRIQSERRRDDLQRRGVGRATGNAGFGREPGRHDVCVECCNASADSGADAPADSRSRHAGSDRPASDVGADVFSRHSSADPRAQHGRSLRAT
mmetsp:Transcript_30458/g.73462  ORF Transcript_30458/g.73462 Transcript_30458/m.73462 type:complete len:345 (+) Transcript_30458:960-1994(+)